MLKVILTPSRNLELAVQQFTLTDLDEYLAIERQFGYYCAFLIAMLKLFTFSAFGSRNTRQATVLFRLYFLTRAPENFCLTCLCFSMMSSQD